MVKPMPATDEAATSDGQPTASACPPSRGRVASHEPMGMPSVLPATRPTTMAMTSGDVRRPSRSPPRGTPALTSANSGTTKKLDAGWRACCSRSFGESEREMLRAASAASSGLGRWRKARATPVASSRLARLGG